MVILALDLGKKKVGVALSHGVVAQALEVLDFESAGFVIHLQKIIAEQKVEVLVVGVPYGKDGFENEQTKWTFEQAKILKNQLGLPIKLVDEAFSTFAASQSYFGKKMHEDAEAAKIILEQYLNENADKTL